MKNSIKLTMITCLLLSNVFSQEKGNGFGFTFNGGSSIMNLMMGEASMTPTVYYMYNLPNSTIEPSLGYFSTSSNGETSSMTTLGVGYLKNRSQSDNFGTYWGGRFSIMMVSPKSAFFDDVISVSPVCGTEYSFSNNFSIGGETRFNLLMSTGEDESSIRHISAHLFFRFYK